MASRSFSGSRPQIPHLVLRRQGGLSGEVVDLRGDVETAFKSLEGEVDNYCVVEDEGVELHRGPVKLNFTGLGVVVSMDITDPTLANITISGTAGNEEESITFADYPGPVLIGSLKAGRVVEEVVIEVLSAFDSGVLVTVGDDTAHGRLMTADASLLTAIGTYEADSNYKYTADTDVYLYFSGVAPTSGTLRVIVYFS